MPDHVALIPPKSRPVDTEGLGLVDENGVSIRATAVFDITHLCGPESEAAIYNVPARLVVGTSHGQTMIRLRDGCASQHFAMFGGERKKDLDRMSDEGFERACKRLDISPERLAGIMRTALVGLH